MNKEYNKTVFLNTISLTCTLLSLSSSFSIIDVRLLYTRHKGPSINYVTPKAGEGVELIVTRCDIGGRADRDSYVTRQKNFVRYFV